MYLVVYDVYRLILMKLCAFSSIIIFLYFKFQNTQMYNRISMLCEYIWLRQLNRLVLKNKHIVTCH